MMSPEGLGTVGAEDVSVCPLRGKGAAHRRPRDPGEDSSRAALVPHSMLQFDPVVT